MILKKLSQSGIFIQSGIILLVLFSHFYFPGARTGFNYDLLSHLILFHSLSSVIQPLGLFWSAFWGGTLILLCGFAYNQIAVQADLLPKQKVFVVLIYSLLLLLGGFMFNFLVSVLITLLLLGSFYNMSGLVSGQHSYFKVMNATLGISIASLIVPQAVFFMLFVWLGFLTVRIGAWREWVISLIGFLTPYFYYVIFLFLSDGLNEVIEGYQLFFKGYKLNFSGFGFSEMAIFTVIILLALFSIPSFLSDAGERIISIRKKMWLHFHFFWIGLIALGFSSQGAGIWMPVVLLPIALFIAHNVVFKRKSWAIDVLMIVLIGLIVGLRAGF